MTLEENALIILDTAGDDIRAPENALEKQPSSELHFGQFLLSVLRRLAPHRREHPKQQLPESDRAACLDCSV